jgi:hypothetical protein
VIDSGKKRRSWAEGLKEEAKNLEKEGDAGEIISLRLLGESESI